MNISTEAQTAPKFPIVYAMEVDAPNGAGEFAHGDLALFNTIEHPAQGDVVCVHLRRGGAVLLTMQCGLPVEVWRAMPQPMKGDVDTLVCGQILGTNRGIAIKASDCLGVHKCDGKADPADCGRGA